MFAIQPSHLLLLLTRRRFIHLLTLMLTLLVTVDSADEQTKAQTPSFRTWIVNQNHPNASDKGEGTQTRPFKTISRAAELARPGDTILVYSGIYRERIAPPRGGEPERPIIYKAVPGEKVIIKGSEIWTPEPQPLEGYPNVCSGTLNSDRFRDLSDYNPYRIKLQRMNGNRTLGQVFVDGEPLDEVDSLEQLLRKENSWIFSPDKDRLYVHFAASPTPPQSRLVEVTVRERIFAPYQRGLGYIHVQGFIFEHAANQFPSAFWDKKNTPQTGAVGTRSGHHWVIENNIIRYAKAIGLDCGSEAPYEIAGEPIPEVVGYHLIRNNLINDNGCCGIAGFRHTGTQIIGNQIERNNRLGWTAPETGGIKVHMFVDGLIEANLVRDNDASGIWLDNIWHNSRVTRNVVINNLGSGIFVEMGNGPILVDNNVVAYTRLGDGIYTHDASGVTVAHNLLYGNSHFGVYMRTVTERQFKQENGELKVVETSHQRIYNNVFVDNYRGNICLPLPSKRGFDNRSDYNLLIGGTQWQWEGLGFARFVLNTNDGRIKREQLLEAFRAALDAGNFAEKPNLELWIEQPYLTLDWWRVLTENDIHSVAPKIDLGEVEVGAIEKGSMNLSARGLYIEFASDEPLQMLHPPSVKGVDRDFFANPMPTENLLAGPFQNLRKGENWFYLWSIQPKEAKNL